ncbi:hypothetical protein [Streptomyces sp. NPDC056987]|uniref:hypothetical protein n=1 Tax=Streptomyces sp. NPDC056987 TaxID=3345988 RepID=UPI00362EC9DA
MDIFVTVIALIALFALVLAPPLYWHLKDLAVDRQLHRAEHPTEHPTEQRSEHERRQGPRAAGRAGLTASPLRTAGVGVAAGSMAPVVRTGVSPFRAHGRK